MDRFDFLDRFELDDNQIVDKQIETVAAIELCPFILDG